MLGIGTAGSADLTIFLLRENWVFLALGLLFSTPLVSKTLGALWAGREEKPLWALGKTAGYMLLLLLSVSYLAMGAHNPFIYFHF